MEQYINTIAKFATKITMRQYFFFTCSATYLSTFFTPVLRGTVEKTFGGQMQFLTTIGLGLTTLTLFFNSYASYNVLTYDMLVLSTTIESIITLYYWGCYIFDKSLLYPANMETIPLAVDVLLHLLPAVALWTELLTTVESHKMSNRHVKIISIFSAAYMIWTELCYYKNNYYVYPFLHLLDTKSKFGLTLATTLLAIGVNFVSTRIHRLYKMYVSKTDFEKVVQFNKTFGVTVYDLPKPELLENDKKLVNFRMDLIREEVKELETAVEDNDFVEVIDALSDILYVVHGMGSSLGINLDKAFDIVHKSNMSKACRSETEAMETVAYYEANKEKLGYDSPSYKLSADGRYFIVYNKSTTKVLKSINYKPADFSGLLAASSRELPQLS